MEMLSPGVYARETDFSAYVRAQSTATFGMVGVFERGPIGEAVLVTSLEDAKSKLGTYLDGHHGMFGLDAFFKNGGARAFVVRTATSAAALATVTISDRHATAPVATLRVDASSEGAWGNDLNVEVTASAAFPSTGFNLIVKNDAGDVLESHKDLLLDAASEDYVEKRVSAKSTLISATDLASGTAAPDNRPALGTFALAGGVSGDTGLTASDFTGKLAALDAVDVNFVAVPGESVAAAVAVALKDYSETRKDCVAILETPLGADVAAMTAHRETIAINSSYAAIYGPWLEMAHPVTGRKVDLAPSGVVAGIYARNDALGAVWTAPAGLNRATVRGVLGAKHRISKGERDVLQGKQVNPISTVNGALTVYGQMTLQTKASATDRVNVRRLMAFVEKSVIDAAQSLVFEANDKGTWEAFKRTVNPFLQRIKDGGGFYDFVTICDENLNTPAVVDTNTMKARIMVKPTKTAEYIGVEFALAPSGADFSEL